MNLQDLLGATTEALGDGQTRFLVTYTGGLQYGFWAEDEAHARDQAANAEPDLFIEAVEAA